MGVLLDSTVLIAGERQGRSAREVLSALAPQMPGEQIAILVITALELEHGAARAAQPERVQKRRRFLSDLTTAVPVYPVSLAMALRAGQLDAAAAARGERVALADLLIGATALQLEFTLATHNLRHFERLPQLNLLRL